MCQSPLSYDLVDCHQLYEVDVATSGRFCVDGMVELDHKGPAPGTPEGMGGGIPSVVSGKEVCDVNGGLMRVACGYAADAVTEKAEDDGDL